MIRATCEADDFWQVLAAEAQPGRPLKLTMFRQYRQPYCLSPG